MQRGGYGMQHIKYREAVLSLYAFKPTCNLHIHFNTLFYSTSVQLNKYFILCMIYWISQILLQSLALPQHRRIESYLSTRHVLLLVLFSSLGQLLSGGAMTHRGGLCACVCMALWQNNPHRVSVYRKTLRIRVDRFFLNLSGIWVYEPSKLWHELFLSWGSNFTCVSRISS